MQTQLIRVDANTILLDETHSQNYHLRILGFSPVAQQVEQVAVNHLVGGSIPSRGAIFSTANVGDSLVSRP